MTTISADWIAGHLQCSYDRSGAAPFCIKNSKRRRKGGRKRGRKEGEKEGRKGEREDGREGGREGREERNEKKDQRKVREKNICGLGERRKEILRSTFVHTLRSSYTTILMIL